MSDFEIKEALQLRNQRFVAVLAFTLHNLDNQGRYDHSGMGAMVDDAIDDADAMIAKLEAPTR